LLKKKRGKTHGGFLSLFNEKKTQGRKKGKIGSSYIHKKPGFPDLDHWRKDGTEGKE